MSSSEESSSLSTAGASTASSSTSRKTFSSTDRAQFAIACVTDGQRVTPYQFHSEPASAGQEIIDNLYNNIFKQRIIRDASLGISAQLIEVNGKPMYLRDASNVDSKPLTATQIAIAERGNAKMMALNYLLAYQRLAIQFKLPADDFVTIEQARIMAALSDPDSDAVKVLSDWVNQTVLKQLSEKFESQHIAFSRKEVRQLFNRVNQAAALEHASAYTATVHNIKGHLAAQMETPVSPASQAYETEIKDRHDKIWFQSLSKTDRLVVDMYADKLLSPDHVIPSQLRDLVPGTRNLFRYQVFTKSKPNSPLTPLIDCHHTGTAVTLVKPAPNSGISVKEANEEQLRLTQLNMSLQRRGAGHNFDISHMASLNSDKADLFIQPGAYVKELKAYSKRRFRGMAKEEAKKRIKEHGDDRPIVKMTTQAPEGHDDLLASNFVFNGFRLLSSDHLTGTEFTLTNSKSLYLALIDGIKRGVLTDSNTPKGFAKQVEQLGDSIVQLEQMVEQRGSPKSYRFHGYAQGDFTDKNFRAKDILTFTAQVTLKTNQLVSMLENAGFLPKGDARNPKKINFCFGCASGENRTGAGLFHLTLASLQQAIPELSEQQAAGFLANSYHIQDCIGGQGGVLGGAGARYKSKGSWTKSLADFTDTFFQRIADIKKSIPRGTHYQTSRDEAIYARMKQEQRRILTCTDKRRKGPNIKSFKLRVDGKSRTLYITTQEKQTLDTIRDIRNEWHNTGQYNEEKIDALFPGFLGTLSEELSESSSEDEIVPPSP